MGSVASTNVAAVAGKSEARGLSFYLRDLKWMVLSIVGLTAFYLVCIWYQQTFGHLYGMDSHSPEFDQYFMSILWAELTLLPVLAVIVWSAVWMTRPRGENPASVSAREEIRRYFTFVMWLVVYTYAVYWGASYFAEQDGSWHQVVTRDTSFTPSHLFIFYLSFPVYIIIGVASLIYAATRLPMYRANGVSIAHVLAVVGPFMILPNVGLNEWGHAFWFMEELFTAPLHWGFTALGWTGLALGGVLMQIVQRVNYLMPQIKD